MLRFAVAAVSFLAVAGPAIAAPSGWQAASDHHKVCDAAVPPNWTKGAYGLGMKAPQNHATLAMSSTEADLATAKQVFGGSFHVTQTLEDSAGRYWVAYDVAGRRKSTGWYVAVVSGPTLCAMQLTFDAGLPDADARAIVLSLHKR
ncbi:MAG TPA: hypothetical protein VHD15_09800 [Hyphomicrobiales bacterium]|nr:hypothetical protein [Hyphomicrobiales bacterium]